MTGNRFVWVPFWILVLLIIGGTMLIDNVKAEYDCLDYALESGEPVMLIGKHPYFYGSTSINHFVNYKQIDNRTFEIYDYMYGCNYTVSGNFDEIRPGVYFDGFSYYKLFLYREPQRYWRRMI